MSKDKVLKLFESTYEKIGANYFFRVMTAVYLFDFLDRLRVKKYPSGWYSLLDEQLKQLVVNFDFFTVSFDFSQNGFQNWKNSTSDQGVEFRTGKVYSDLWKDFKNEELFEQTFDILKERFEKNNILLSSVKLALDDGCGSGRYSFALKRLGCEAVRGIDISREAVELARKINPFGLNEVSFTQGSVLDLPFDNETFDFVFSNGVLHHTKDDRKGLSEIYRVLKPGGKCWLYLYGGKDSLFWDIVDFGRKLVSEIPQAFTQSLMSVMGYPPGRIFHRSDFLYVPLNKRYFTKEVEEMIVSAGFSDFRRLNRGVEYDWDEIIYSNPGIDSYVFGEGEMRYLIEKVI